MIQHPCFPDELRTRDDGYRDGTRWFAVEHYFRVITSKGTFTVPTGFLTDGLSTPRFSHALIGPMSKAFYAGIWHDWAYSKASNGHFPENRKLADQIFLELMYNLGLSWIERYTIYSAVRAFGWMSYKKR